MGRKRKTAALIIKSGGARVKQILPAAPFSVERVAAAMFSRHAPFVFPEERPAAGDYRIIRAPQFLLLHQDFVKDVEGEATTFGARMPFRTPKNGCNCNRDLMFHR